ncbi:MAG: aconitate hydratase AcnA [Thermoplasmata archaeon]|nr:aconitate hydratase AcnA [Thermoplasmata archaeon]
MNRRDILGIAEPLSEEPGAPSLYPLDRLPGVDRRRLETRPLTVKIVLENLIRNFDPDRLDRSLLLSVAHGDPIPPETELPFYPSRVLLQDFTGVPVLVDLTAIRTAAVSRGLPASRVNPVVPVDLIVDHSVQVDSFGARNSGLINLDREYQRNGERYDLLRWAQGGFTHLRVVPPGNGICHQVNLEYLATVASRRERDGVIEIFPDTLIGTDSHTTMVNGLGVLGWGAGGIEAEAAMLGEPCLLPPLEVVGVRLSGRLPEGATATDLVLTVTKALRQKGVVEKFVEFFGPGLDCLSVPDRATISNMCPEYGATAALFPIDGATIAYLTSTGRDPAHVREVEAYARRQGLWRDAATPSPRFDDELPIDLASIVPTVSGPRNPEESVSLSEAPRSFRTALEGYRREHPRPTTAPANGAGIPDGAVVIAAITSCTNTSNPSVMVGAGLIARKAVELGLAVPPHVKTSLAPGSKVVTAYLERANLMAPLEQLGFDLVGYGCTTCIGNSGPLPPAVARAVEASDAYVAAVLSGNRNFEARIHSQVRANYLASPMLVVAYALAGRFDLDLTKDPLGHARGGAPVYLRDLWPKSEEIRQLVDSSLDPQMFRDKYRTITQGDPHWDSLPSSGGPEYRWDPKSTYLRHPPYFSIPPPPPPVDGVLIQSARVLALLDDRVSTDHISPAGEIAVDSPAGRYLEGEGVRPADFNTYGTRRGNHEVMVRGTFANIRLKNRLAPGTEGGWTTHIPSGTRYTIYDAAERYRAEGIPLIVLAGASYGQGSSRDWAAKGPLLLGVRAVIAKSYERIHRGNLVGMGVLPLQFEPGEGWKELGLTGEESFSFRVPGGGASGPRATIEVTATRADGGVRKFSVRSRIDSAVELDYYRSGGLLPYTLGRLAA